MITDLQGFFAVCFYTICLMKKTV